MSDHVTEKSDPLFEAAPTESSSIDSANEVEPTTAEQLSSAKWLQGAVLPPIALSGQQLDDGSAIDSALDLPVIITGDCNLLHHDDLAEPVAELLCARRVDALDGRFTNRKNPRILHLPVRNPAIGPVLEFAAGRRIGIQRKMLIDCQPMAQLGHEERLMLAQWYAFGRYLRSSFPDEFNRRVSAVMRRLERKMKSHGTHIVAILAAVGPERELPPTERYKAVLRVVISRVADTNAVIKRQIDDAVYAPLVDGLKAQNVELDHHLVGAHDFSYEEGMLLNRLEYDHLSLAADPPDQVAPRG